MAKFQVEVGRLDHAIRSINDEDGWERVEVIWNYRVGFRTVYGIDYMLLHAFPDTAEGKAHAERTAARIQAVLDTKGLDGIEETRWSTRTIYGSQAYIDEEPYIVARERSDALMGV